MPNGYTADIYEGKDVSLRDYLMGVGRGMGFAIMQRDDPADEPVKRVEDYTSSYRKEALDKAYALLEELSGMSIVEAERRAQAEYLEAKQRWEDRKFEKQALRGRYDEMRAKVEAWDVPPLLAPVKEHALKYLDESADFDCGPSGEEMKYYERYPVRKGGALWMNEAREQAQKDIDYHTREQEEERERNAERNLWIDTFLAALPED